MRIRVNGMANEENGAKGRMPDEMFNTGTKP